MRPLAPARPRLNLRLRQRLRLRRRSRGHSLLELVVTVAIVATLAAAATATYSRSLLVARRADARAALLALATAQERHYLRHARYAAALAPPGARGPSPAAVLDWPATSPQAHYALRIAASTPESYRLEARAVGAQARDRDCAVYALDELGTRAALDAHGVDARARCW